MLGVGINLLTLAIRKIAGALGFYPKTIDQSLRFNDDDTAYLKRTPSVSGNRQTWTFSAWVKRGNLGVTKAIFGSSPNAYHSFYLTFNANDKLSISEYDHPSGPFTLITTQVFRDPSAWYHIVLSYDTTQATSSDRIKLYVNGERIIQFDTEQYPVQNYNNASVNLGGSNHLIGGDYIGTTVSELFDGYLAEVHFTDGTAYTADDFGEFKSGVWVAKTPSVTYGTNGFYLKFANSGALGTDSSGNSNTWTPTNLAATDVMLDSPTNNFATLNPVYKPDYATPVYSEGNLKGGGVSGATAQATISFSSGKWYMENICTDSNHDSMFGIAKSSSVLGSYVGNNAYGLSYHTSGAYYYNGASTAYGNTFVDGDVIGICVDADANKIYFSINGVWQNSSDPVAGTNGISIPSTIYGDFITFAFRTSAITSNYMVANFGQDSSFAGTKTAQGNTDDNGIGDFYYAPPTGYLALCTANLPEPAISPLNGVSPTDYFNTVLYTGNGTSQSISGTGFQSDLIWIKGRNAASAHSLQDSVRGFDEQLASHLTAAEITDTTEVTSVNSDGFDVGNSTGAGYGVNISGRTYVAWNWKANGTPVSNTDGTITSSVSANTESGFSIISYTGNGIAGSSIGHGLNQTPELFIIKNRSAVVDWLVGYFPTASNCGLMWFNKTDSGAVSAWNSADDTTISIDFDMSNVQNTNGHNYICYAFHSVEGFSKIGTYTGNGSSTDGTFVYTGFRPAFILTKRVDTTSNWTMYDSVRSTYNASTRVLYPNLANTEDASIDHFDWLSNGFKCRSTNINASGGTYIYMAFAEMPFKYSVGR